VHKKFLICPGSNISFDILDSVLAPMVNFSDHESSEYDKNCRSKLLGDTLLPHDMKRLEAYSNNLVDYHLVSNPMK
jgi:N-acetyltransferase 10